MVFISPHFWSLKSGPPRQCSEAAFGSRGWWRDRLIWDTAHWTCQMFTSWWFDLCFDDDCSLADDEGNYLRQLVQMSRLSVYQAVSFRDATPLLLPPKPTTNSQQQLKVSSLNVRVLTWRLIKMIRVLVPLSNLFSPDGNGLSCHSCGGGYSRSYYFYMIFIWLQEKR